jgi:hypothetical protein
MHTALRNGFHSFASLAKTHDDLPAFNAAYWVLTFLAAMLFNAGAFAILIAGHVVLDVYKYREVHRKKWPKVIEGVVRENLLDVSLLSLGLAFSVYVHASLPIFAGIRGVMRTEITVVNALLQVTVKAHILHNALMVLSHLYKYLRAVHPRLGRATSFLEGVAFAGLVASTTLILLAPWILGMDAHQVAALAAELLVPWHM